MEEVDVATNCTDCHNELYLYSYHRHPTSYYYGPPVIRRYFYHEPYYYRWGYYSSYPWWWDDYAYDYYYYRPSYSYDPKNYKVDPQTPQKKRDWDRRSGMKSEPPASRTKSSGNFGGGVSPGPSYYEKPAETGKPDPVRDKPSSPLIYRSRRDSQEKDKKEVRTKPAEKKEDSSKDDEQQEKKKPKRRKGMD